MYQCGLYFTQIYIYTFENKFLSSDNRKSVIDIPRNSTYSPATSKIKFSFSSRYRCISLFMNTFNTFKFISWG